MKIFNDGFEVYASGTVYSPTNSDMRFVIIDEPLFQVVFRVIFNKELDKKIELKVEDGNTAVMEFRNPGGLGYGNSNPARVGYIEGKELYVVFSISTKGTPPNGYDLNYTFLLKEASHG